MQWHMNGWWFKVSEKKQWCQKNVFWSKYWYLRIYGQKVILSKLSQKRALHRNVGIYGDMDRKRFFQNYQKPYCRRYGQKSIFFQNYQKPYFRRYGQKMIFRNDLGNFVFVDMFIFSETLAKNDFLKVIS